MATTAGSICQLNQPQPMLEIIIIYIIEEKKEKKEIIIIQNLKGKSLLLSFHKPKVKDGFNICLYPLKYSICVSYDFSKSWS